MPTIRRLGRRQRDLSQLLEFANDIRQSRAQRHEYTELIDKFSQSVGLDDMLLARAKKLITNKPPVAVTRRPITRGQGSFWLSEVTLTNGDHTQLKLMEKAVEASGPEALFWASASSKGFHLSGNRFSSVGPLFSIAVGPVTVHYLPYLDAPHRHGPSCRRNYRSNIDELVRAVAEFNGSNIISAEQTYDQLRPIPRRTKTPPVEHIQTGLGLQSRHTARILWAACKNIDARWTELQDMYNAIPACLCHNDLGPGNAIIHNAQVHLLDFEKAGLAPVGSDMHTIIRWGGQSLVDDHEAERLLALYAQEVQRLRPEVTLEHVRTGAWITFFIRYSAIMKWSSARNVDSFSLALLKADELLDAHR